MTQSRSPPFTFGPGKPLTAACCRRPISRDTDTDPAQVGELMGLYLLPQAWGKGLGRVLMAAAVAHLAVASYSQSTLWVLESNARARRFYAKAGWIEDGAVKQDDRLGFAITEVRYRRRLL
jgi:GNAT superfamily N-acetyltransferase